MKKLAGLYRATHQQLAGEDLQTRHHITIGRQMTLVTEEKSGHLSQVQCTV